MTKTIEFVIQERYLKSRRPVEFVWFDKSKHSSLKEAKNYFERTGFIEPWSRIIKRTIYVEDIKELDKHEHQRMFII